MLTRITRYTLLVLCLLVVGVWGWSCFHYEAVGYIHSTRLDGFTLESGRLAIYRVNDASYWRDGFSQQHYQPMNAIPNITGVFYEVGGFKLFSWAASLTRNGKGIIVPLWMPLIAILIPTVRMWYRPIRNRLRGKRDAGFAVEAKNDAG